MALPTILLTWELALASMLLILLERLLRAEPVAVAATEDRLETSEDTEAPMEEARDSAEVNTELMADSATGVDG